jgi:hypothetical protein
VRSKKATAGTWTRAERLSGWIIPVAKGRAFQCFTARRLMKFKLASEDDGRTFVLVLVKAKRLLQL